MPYVQNSAGYENPFGGLVSNMAKIMLSGPTMDERAAQQALAAARQAQARKFEIETGDLQSAATGRSALANLFSEVPSQRAVVQQSQDPGFVGPIDPGTVQDANGFMSAMPSRAAAAAVQAGDTMPQNLGAVMRAMIANTPGTSDNEVVRALAGGGDALGENESVSIPGQDRVRTANAKNSMAQAMGVAETQASASRYGTDVGAATSRRGQDVGATTAYRGQDMTARTTERGQDMTAATSRRGQDMDVANKKPPVVSFSDLGRIDQEITATFGESEVPPEVGAMIRQEASRLYQANGGNAATAVGDAIRNLTETGAIAKEETGLFGWGDGRVVARPDAPSPAAAAMTGQPGPAAPAQAPATLAAPAAPAQAVPPLAQRVPGQVYDTPRGPMTWTGTGWVPAGA